jgi:hypothetical protein
MNAVSSIFQPSITIWQRYLGVPRDPTLAMPLQAQVRDPLWFLARQWQLGEFAGNDAGSPIQASYGVRTRVLTQFVPKQGAAFPPSPPTATPAPQMPPAEPLAEQESATGSSMGMRFRFQLGCYFERWVSTLTPPPTSTPAQIISDVRQQYPITSDVLTIEDTPSTQLFGLVGGGKSTDGVKFLSDVQALLAGAANTVPASAASIPTAALTALVTHCRSVFDLPPADSSSWDPKWLQYSFSVESQVPGNSTANPPQPALPTITLDCTDFPGGYLDWYYFSLDAESGNLDQDPEQYYSFLPTHISFKGAPANTHWHFEDAQSDFGQLDVEKANLPAVLVSEFATIYGNDWFVVPVPMPIGSLASIDTVVVADTFGTRTLIRPTSAATPSGATWTMFTLTGANTGTDMVLLAPMLGIVDDGPDLETVDFLRDDVAALGWGVERTVPGPLDVGIDAFESFLVRISGQPAPPPALTPNTQVAYGLGSTVPDNWIPLVPTLDPLNPPMYLQRGVMTRETLSSTGSTEVLNIEPRGVILSPSPLIIADQAVSNAGLNVARYCRRARLMDGSVALWIARQTRPGVGPGSSGLLFDQVTTPPPT